MRIGLYARVSSDSNEQENALAQQLDRLRSAAHGHEAVEFVEVMSGTRDDRPQLAKLMEACKRGELDRVICTRLDRLSRSMAHGAQLLSYFSAPDTPSLLALDDQLDLATVNGRLMANILISFGVAESDRLSERVCHGKRYHRKQLKPFGPFAPYGYRFNASRTNYELDPNTAAHARALVERFLQEPVLRKLVREASQVPGCTLNNACSLRRWLGNPTLAGFRVYGKFRYYRDTNGKQKKQMRHPWDWAEIYPNCHPPLISVAEHEQVVRILRNHSNRQRSALSPRYVGKLTGLVRCAHCHCLLFYQHVQYKKYNYLFCHNSNCVKEKKTRIRSEIVEAAIWEALRQHPKQLLAVALYNHVKGPEIITAEQELRSQIYELETKEDPDLAEAIVKKRERLSSLIQQRMELSSTEQEQEAMAQALQSEEFWQLAQSDPARCRAFFSEYVDHVVVRGSEVEEVLLRLPSQAALANARLPFSDPQQDGARPQPLPHA